MVLMALLAVGCEGPDAAWRSEAIDECQTTVDSTGALIIVGEEGKMELCSCAADSLQARYPDVSERWDEYATEVDDRFDRRGLIGLVADTTWINTRGVEMANFATGYLQTIAKCTELTVQTSVNGIPPR
jgi:hypothetical protein